MDSVTGTFGCRSCNFTKNLATSGVVRRRPECAPADLHLGHRPRRRVLFEWRHRVVPCGLRTSARQRPAEAASSWRTRPPPWAVPWPSLIGRAAAHRLPSSAAAATSSTTERYVSARHTPLEYDEGFTRVTDTREA